MKCYDCDLAERGDTTAIGVCSRCGLVVCRAHARVTQVLVHLQRGPGKSSGDRPARRVVCGTCYGAEHPN
ncbi:DUF2180 family protein [Streptomyces albus subsp. chlorinus]|uniref:DUF2180 family protein n=1 Tax=Streptomyces albus TaxID=1888 RepID=UPI00156EA709|nr:DUF2180 family protein [Streptomyces albus]NSC24510.1 DUF2180 family protein [Streptomyces albus subsp. chlorinus]